MAYRREYGIPDTLGTAVTVQQMVFGNMGETLATGVAFTRNPATGDQGLFGEFLLNGQGEDVVAGIRTPRPLSEMEAVLPGTYRQFLDRLQGPCEGDRRARGARRGHRRATAAAMGCGEPGGAEPDAWAVGCRLGLLKPEVYLMQARAIAKAARTVREEGGDPVVEIVIPLVGFPSELERMRTRILEELAEESPPIGTIIELPRACAVANEIADHADFFSFGTNDLTQMVCGISRDERRRSSWQST